MHVSMLDTGIDVLIDLDPKEGKGTELTSVKKDILREKSGLGRSQRCGGC